MVRSIAQKYAFLVSMTMIAIIYHSICHAATPPCRAKLIECIDGTANCNDKSILFRVDPILNTLDWLRANQLYYFTFPRGEFKVGDQACIYDDRSNNSIFCHMLKAEDFPAAMPSHIKFALNGYQLRPPVELIHWWTLLDLVDGAQTIEAGFVRGTVDIAARRSFVRSNISVAAKGLELCPSSQDICGDFNNDKIFSSADLVAIYQIGGEGASITHGDCNGNEIFDTDDLIKAFQIGNYIE